MRDVLLEGIVLLELVSQKSKRMSSVYTIHKDDAYDEQPVVNMESCSQLYTQADVGEAGREEALDLDHMVLLRGALLAGQIGTGVRRETLGSTVPNYRTGLVI